MLTAETQAKTAGFKLLSGLVWGNNIPTIIYNYTYVSNSIYNYTYVILYDIYTYVIHG